MAYSNPDFVPKSVKFMSEPNSDFEKHLVTNSCRGRGRAYDLQPRIGVYLIVYQGLSFKNKSDHIILKCHQYGRVNVVVKY